MTFLSELLAWFTDPLNWQGTSGIPIRTWEHIQYSVAATLIAAVIALPIALYLGHTGRGGLLAINIANIGRAIPSLGLIIMAFILLGLNIIPVMIALVALAIPPIVTNTYIGIRNVNREVRDAAGGMGMTGWQILTQVEIPVAMPLIMAGLRTSAVQVVATATLAAYLSFGGLGRYLFDGLALQDYEQLTGGALLIAALSLITEFVLARLQAVVVPKGLAKRNATATVDAKMSGKAGVASSGA